MPGDGWLHGPASACSGFPDGVSAGQVGWLAMVIMAGAMRVRVSFAVARPKLLGDFDLRARCRSRSTTVRYLAISLVSAS